jgi:short-subunit dehydrogenase
MPGPTETEFFDRAGLQDSRLGEIKKGDPAEVARQGIAALLAGKDHVVAGSVKNKLQAVAGRILPETTKAAMQGRLTEPRGNDDSA